MNGPLLESVPNFSEGRRTEVVERIARAATAGTGGRVRRLDLSSDPDHDRSVLTLAGPPDDLVAALVELFAAALEEIDLSARARDPSPGVHPCIGAVDVVPFVPLGATPMAVAVAAAERLGARVAERFGLPVYLYEEAARRPERRNLAEIRRGGFEGLAARAADPSDPASRPDFGPARPHPTGGATAIGARGFLVAFNVVLDRDDLEAAREIARAVRASSPAGTGLPALKAIGVRLASRGLAQVSINLTDPTRTTPFAALAAVEREAAARGVGVAECELIGLMPEGAAERSLAEALRLDGFRLDRTVERRLAASGDDAVR